MEINVDDEVNGRRITLLLSQEQYERAQIDQEYLQQLIAQYDADAAIVAHHATEPVVETPQEQDPQGLFIWNESCIFLLLALYEEMKEEMGRKRHKTVFVDIATKMNETNQEYRVSGSQCQSKINSLKKTYKKIVDHNATSGNDRATWPYFDRMNEIFGSAGWANPDALASEAGLSVNEPVPDSSTQKKRKIDAVLHEFTQDIKKYREERAKTKRDNFNKLLEMKERQHREKMEILKSLCNNSNV